MWPSRAVLLAIAALVGCSHSWDDYSPSGGSPSGSTGQGGAGAAAGAGAGASSGSSTSSSSSSSSGSATGTGGLGGQGPECPPEPDSAGLVGYWKLDEGAGADALDASGVGNDAVLKNGATWLAAPAGIQGGAVSLDGTDDLLEVASSASLNLDGDFTLAAWLLAETISTMPPGRNPRLFQKGMTAASTTYGLSLESATEPPLAHTFFRIAAGPQSIDGVTPVTAGAWHHLVGVRQGPNLSVYLDGALDATGVFAEDAITAVAEPLFIGKSPGNSDGAVDGSVDELRIYARALSPAEIEALACAGRARP